MKFRFLYIVFCLSFLGIFNSSPVSAETGKLADKKSIISGKALYEKYCLRCHQKNAVGEAKIPATIRRPGYITAMPLNEASHAWHHSDEQLIGNILNGLARTKRMPAFKSRMSEKEAGDVVEYIKSLWPSRIVACQGPRHMNCM